MSRGQRLIERDRGLRSRSHRTSRAEAKFGSKSGVTLRSLIIHAKQLDITILPEEIDLLREK